MNKERLIEVLNEQYPDFPVFDSDIKREEVEANGTFFVFRESSNFFRGESGRSLMRKVYVQFVTKESKQVDIITLVPEIQTAGLYFVSSDEDLGKIQGTDKEALMITMEFNVQVRKCLI